MRVLSGILFLLLVAQSGMLAQVPVQLADRGPRFLLASHPAAKPTVVDARKVAVLRQRISLDLEDVTLEEALTSISRQAGLRLMYSKAVVPLESRVRLQAKGITVAGALTEVLFDAGVDVLLTANGQAVLTRRAVTAKVEVQGGSIVGRVTDAKTGQGLEGTEVLVDGTRWRTLSGTDGQYRVAEVDTGTYVVTVRRIGYTRQSRSVTVVEGQETTADFALAALVTKLDELVTTGTVIPTELKALPTPVSVITSQDFASQRPRTVGELFRQQIPTAISWDLPSSPQSTTFSVRGASKLSGTVAAMKVFVDGIPLSDFTNARVDPNSIARAEVIRGPQAAAIYGSDALGGVIQMFTKRGDSLTARPNVNGEAALGIVQTPYAGYRSELRQEYRGSLLGGGPGVSYYFGAGYDRTPDWVEPESGQSNTSVYGGMHVSRGVLTADASGRYYLQNAPIVFNPEIAATGLPFFTKPSYQILQAKSHTLGAKLTLSPTGWWLHNLTAGIDRYTNSTTQTQPRLTTPDDTFFTAVERDLSKTFIAYNSSILGDLGKNVAGSVTVGFDHYSLPFDFWASTSALSTSGATGNVGDATAIRTTTNNTGYFAQAMVGIRDAVFLTGGVRAEENTQFGSSVGTPVSPQFGLTYVKQLGGSTIKVRGSWGRAIRPPGAGAKVGSVSPFDVTLPNPLLGPERQKGWDTGVDAVFGRRGSLSLTYFNQTALDLISLVVMPSDSLPTFQNQNVGRVKNTGVEIEALLSIGVLSVRGQYGYVRSRIQDPGSTTGELVAGDELLDVPTHTAGVSVSVVPRSGTVVTAGATYVGDYLDYDYMTMLRCFAETGPCLSGPGLRAYRSKLPSLFKVNAAISQQITPVVSGFVSVNNLTNNEKIEFNMFNPVMGRITTVGLQFHQ